MKKLTLALASAASLAVVACAEPVDETTAVESDNVAADQMANADEAPGTIADVVTSDDNFSTLLTAINAAELGETLSGDGPFTVFAPTNDAFGKVPGDTLTTLMSEEGKEDLTGILTYHVVEGNVDAATLTKAITDAGDDGYTITTLAGGTLTAMMDGGNVVLTDGAGNTSTVTATDVEASNGVIHVIDTVLMPS